MPRLSIAAGCVLLAGAGVAPGAVLPTAVWIDWPEVAAHSDGWRAAVPADAVAAGSAVPAAERVGHLDGRLAAVAVPRAALRDAVAAPRDALQDAADALPAATVDWLDAPDGPRDDPAGQQDAPDALRDGRDVRRGAPAGCREDLCREDLADCPAGQAERRDGRAAPQDDRVAHPDDRDATRGDRDAHRAGPDECQGDLGH